MPDKYSADDIMVEELKIEIMGYCSLRNIPCPLFNDHMEIWELEKIYGELKAFSMY